MLNVSGLFTFVNIWHICWAFRIEILDFLLTLVKLSSHEKNIYNFIFRTTWFK